MPDYNTTTKFFSKRQCALLELMEYNLNKSTVSAADAPDNLQTDVSPVSAIGVSQSTEIDKLITERQKLLGAADGGADE